MTVFKAFAIIVISGIAFAVLGGVLGWTLGTVTPAYYRTLFSTGRNPNFDPVQVGVGLGVTQGLAGGLVLGAIVVLAVAWYQSRCKETTIHIGPLDSRPFRPHAPEPTAAIKEPGQTRIPPDV